MSAAAPCDERGPVGRGRRSTPPKVAAGLMSLVLLVAIAACGDSSATADDPSGGGRSTKVTVATVATDSGAQAFIAEKKGFFAAHGLDVELQVLAGVPELAAAVQSGHAQFALSSPLSVASAAEKGIPFKLVAPGVLTSDENPGAWILAGNGEKDVHSVADLAGKTIAVNALNTLFHLATLALLEDKGVDTSSVQFVTVNFPAIGQALQSGQVSAGVVVSPFAEQAQATGAARKLSGVFGSVNHGKPFLGSAWFGQADYIAKNADVADRFRAAIADASGWANDQANEVERRKILQSYTKLPDEAINAFQLTEYGRELTKELVQPSIDLMRRFDLLKSITKADAIIATHK
jgi:ABC-type nitrate/sulfonate/bicarbonate transport system substrate-binding protein